MKIRLMLFVACALCLSGVLSAEEVVVTATRTPKAAGKVPASVSVISSDDIVNSSARNVDDLLRHTRGISVLQPTGMGYGLPSQINIRGVPGQSSTLLLVDGMPLNEAGSGFVNINEIPLADVKQVEVVRGAFSALYGADAFGGVINIITRDPDDVPASSASVEVGNEDYTKVSAQASSGTSAMGLVVSVQKRSIDNYLARDTQALTYWDWQTMQYIEYTKNTENYDYEDEHASLKATMDLGDDANLVLHGRYFGSELGYGKTSFAPVYPMQEENVMQNRSVLAGAALEMSLTGKTTAEFRTFYRDQKRMLWGLDFSHMLADLPVYVRSYSETVNNDWRVDGKVRTELNDKNVLSLGGDYYRNDYEFAPVRDSASGNALPLSSGKKGDIYNVAVYFQDEISINDDVELIAGARLDSHSEFDETVSPKVGLLYSVTDATDVRVSVGRAYRAPSAIELFQPAVMFGTTVFDSNPDLDPEYIIAADLGVEQKLSDNAVAYLDLFYNDMEDLIAKQISGNSLVYQNVNEAWSAGVEAGLDCQVADGVNIFASYVYQQSENETTGNDLEHIPEQVASIGLRCSGKVGSYQTEFAIVESYRGDRGYLDLANGMWVELDDYFRTDASVRVRCGKSVYLAMNIQNATDQKFQEWQLINPAQGRLYSIEIGAEYW